MPTRVPVEQNVLKWAVEQSGKSLDDINSKFSKFNEWLDGSTAPTFNQLLSFSNFTNVPFGYLVLKTPPVETLPLLEFRTVDTEQILNPSRELVDTIKDMEKKQAWMRDYLKTEGYGTNTIVNSIKYEPDLNVRKTAQSIRERLGISDKWYEQTGNTSGSFSFLKRIISNQGILVMQNGTALNNTHRLLDINEFRAFALVDDYAPLIFINTRDTSSGKVFSLLHELTHLFIGVDSLYNNNFASINKFTNRLEVFCNAVAAEIVVPKEYFISNWNALDYENKQKIRILSRKFKISTVVISRRALDFRLINQALYSEIAEEAKEHAEFSRNASGGNAINTAQSRIDHRFLHALSTSLDTGFSVYSDVYKLTGLSRNTFEKVEKIVKGGM